MSREIQLWFDEDDRDGPMNMAVDEWLLETVDQPTLRIYQWADGWGSFGYFVPKSEAEAALPDRRLVRRWTGGGIVDHQNDWTYTLVIPGREWLAGARGAESYRTIHSALASALRDQGMQVQLSHENEPARGGECFAQAVEFDLVGAGGAKIAGAGQRRSRQGLLHQGSVGLSAGNELGRSLADQLSGEIRETSFEPDLRDLTNRVNARYGTSKWLDRR